MTHWHDTPEFDRHVEERVESLRAKDEDEATHVCRHFPAFGPDTPTFFMRERSGNTWFLCRACCAHNVSMELLCMDEPPVAA